MNCRTTGTLKLRTRLEFKQYDVTLTKEQSVLIKIKSLFEGETCKQCSVFQYMVSLYFHDYKFAMEIEKNGHSNRNIDFEVK